MTILAKLATAKKIQNTRARTKIGALEMLSNLASSPEIAVSGDALAGIICALVTANQAKILK